MIVKRPLRRGVLVLVLLAALVGVVPASSPAPVSAQSGGLGAGGEYHPLTPARILDTRNAALDVAPGGKKAMSRTGTAFSFPVLGKAGVPTNGDEVLAVVLSVTVVDPDNNGHMTVYPKGASAGTSSLVNFKAGTNVPNLAIVGVGSDGSVTAKLSAGQGGRSHLAIDVFGWVSTSAATTRGARVVAVTPGRIYDSREQGGAMGTKSSIPLQIRGATARDANYQPSVANIVPNSTSVTGVIVNITAVNNLPGAGDTYFSMSPQRVPAGARGASTSNVNVARGQIKPVMAVVPVAADGKVYLYNHRGPAHVVVDVLGYLQVPSNPATTTGRIVPLQAPFRVFDTRLAEFGNVPLGTRQAENWSFKAFADSVKLGGVHVGQQSAFFGNLTGTGLQRRVPWQSVSTYLSMYPGGGSRPFTSNINVAEREDVPNMALVSYGTAKNNAGVNDPYVAQAFNHNGSLHYLVDVFAVVLK